jgi:hypothetical protein
VYLTTPNGMQKFYTTEERNAESAFGALEK